MKQESRRRLLQACLALGAMGVRSGCGMLPTSTKPAPKVPRVGFLEFAQPGGPSVSAFLSGLRELGYVEGQTITVEVRSADGRLERLLEQAAELVALQPDVIVASNSDAIRAIQQASPSIAIVFPAMQDPVGSGLAASLARPGGNVTGLAITAGLEAAKRLELLKETVPGLSCVAILWDRYSALRYRETVAAAQALGVEYLSLELPDSGDLAAVLAPAAVAGVDGLIVMGSFQFSALAPRIVDFTARARLPAMYSIVTSAALGGLLAYAPSILDNFRRAATYVDKILKGARPADLPIELPAVFELIVNLKTAQALGLTIPPSVLAQATEVIR